MSDLWEGAAARLLAKVNATSEPVLVVQPLDYWAAIADGLPEEAQFDSEKQLTIAGVRVVVEDDPA